MSPDLNPRQSSDAWLERNTHWLRQTCKRISRSKRERAGPLILCGHGVSLRVDKERLIVRDGLTHFPQERQTYEFFKGDRALPGRIVMLDGSGALTFDVLTWLSEQNVPLARIDWRGEVASVIGGDRFGLDRDKVQWQIETRNDPARRAAFSAELIAQKLESSLATLRTAVPTSKARNLAEARGEAAVRKLRSGVAPSVDETRAIEATCAASYFAAWRGVPILWERLWRHPVPDHWHTVQPRGSLRARHPVGNRNATHPVNAVLNYAYAVLRTETHIGAASVGYDARRGIMHHDRDDAQAFIYDLMEPSRPRVDAAVLGFLTTTKFRGADFILRDDGVVRLAPQLARRVCQLASRATHEPTELGDLLALN